jgi:hypothetical protein
MIEKQETMNKLIVCGSPAGRSGNLFADAAKRDTALLSLEAECTG